MPEECDLPEWRFLADPPPERGNRGGRPREGYHRRGDGIMIQRQYRKWAAYWWDRLKRRWVYVGLFASEWQARRKAIEAKRKGVPSAKRKDPHCR